MCVSACLCVSKSVGLCIRVRLRQSVCANTLLRVYPCVYVRVLSHTHIHTLTSLGVHSLRHVLTHNVTSLCRHFVRHNDAQLSTRTTLTSKRLVAECTSLPSLCFVAFYFWFLSQNDALPVTSGRRMRCSSCFKTAEITKLHGAECQVSEIDS